MGELVRVWIEKNSFKPLVLRAAKCQVVSAQQSNRSSTMRPPRRRQRFIYDISQRIILFITFTGAGLKTFKRRDVQNL